MNILFVCSRNKWRSRTAETIFKKNGRHRVASAGTSHTAKVRLTQQLLNWADVVYVMENKHRRFIETTFQVESLEATIEVLHITDDYPYMHPELVEILQYQLSNVFE